GLKALGWDGLSVLLGSAQDRLERVKRLHADLILNLFGPGLRLAKHRRGNSGTRSVCGHRLVCCGGPATQRVQVDRNLALGIGRGNPTSWHVTNWTSCAHASCRG